MNYIAAYHQSQLPLDLSLLALTGFNYLQHLCIITDN